MNPQLIADTEGFLKASAPLQEQPEADLLLKKIADDVRAMRRMLEQSKKGDAKRSKDLAEKDGGSGSGTQEKSVESAESEAVARPRAIKGAETGVVASSGAVLKLVQSVQALSTPTLRQGVTRREAMVPAATIVKPILRERDERGRFIAASVPEPATQAAAPAAKIAAPVSRNAVPVSGTAEKSSERSAGEPLGQRDSRGRFTGGSEDQSSTGWKASLLSLKDTISGLSDGIGGLATATSDAGEVDPNIKAAGEVADVARTALSGAKVVTGAAMTIAKPVTSRLFGAKPADAPTPWFRRFFKELQFFRKEQSAYNKAEMRVLKDIEAKPEEGGSRGGVLGMLGGLLMGFLGMLASKIGGFFSPGLGLASKLIPAFASGGKKGAALPTTVAKAGTPNAVSTPGAIDVEGTAAGSAKTGTLGRASKAVGGVLKRIPLLSAALAAVGMGTSVYASETDDTKTREEKDKSTGKAVGGGSGAIAGALAGGAGGAKAGAVVGTLLGGPVGTAIGAAIGGIVGGVAGSFFGEKAGDIVGESVGGWVSDLRKADIPGMIGKAWDKTVAGLSEAWVKAIDGLSGIYGGAKDKVKKVASDVSDKANAANAAIKERTGVDVKASVQQAASATKDAVQSGASAVSEKAGQAKEALSNSMVGKGAKAVYSSAVERWNDAKVYLTGAANKASVDPGILAKIAHFESGFNADAKPQRKDGSLISTAHGYGQFLDGTWTDILNRHGAKYGVEGAGKLTKEEAGKYRDNKSLQAAMLAEFTKENIEKGRKYGGKDDDANVYAFHNLGDGDARKLLAGMTSNPAMSVRQALLQGATTDKERARVESVISGNKSLYGNGDIAVSDAYARMGEKMRSGDSFAADARTVAGAAGSASAVASPATPAPISPVASVVSSSASLPSVKPVSSIAVPSIPDMPSQESASNGARTEAGKTLVVQSAGRNVGRDVADRKIAHIVTGGFAQA